MHQDHAHPEHEAFPRRELAEMVADDDRREHAWARWQLAALALGATLLALAFPTESLLGEGPSLVEGVHDGAWLVVHAALAPIATALGWIPGLAGERAWFLISAVGFGVALVVSMRALERWGAEWLPALAASAITVAAPASWLAATTPGSASLALVGAMLVFGDLGPDATRQGRAGDRRIARNLVLACVLDLRCLWLVPASCIAAARGEETPRPERGFERAVAIVRALAPLAAVFAIAPWLGLTHPEGAAFYGELWEAMLGRGVGTASTFWLIVFGLGAAAFGALPLLMPPRNAEVSRPPIALVAWVIAPLAPQLALGHVDVSTVLIALAPPAALGLSSWLGDRDLARFGRDLALLAAGQISIGWGFQFGLQSRDANAPWRDNAASELRSDDLALSLSGDHLYLLEHRFDVEALDLREPLSRSDEDANAWWLALAGRLRAAGDQGRRVVFDVAEIERDYRYRRELDRMRLVAPSIDLPAH